MKRDKGSSKKYYEYLFTDITGKLDDIEFPAQLTLKEQGRIYLGYYHQKQKNMRKGGKNKWERQLKNRCEFVVLF